MRGKYIVLEGGEGSGKDAQQKRLIKYLKSQGREVIAAREPGTTEFSEVARKEMLSRFNTSAMTQLLIVNAARADTVEHISKLLDQGKWVVCTRNWLSSYTLQGHGMGLPIEDVTDVCALSTKGVEPDLTIIIDISVEQAEKRRMSRGGPDDNYRHRYEELDLEFHERVRKGYIEAAKRFNYPLVDGSKSKNEVEKDIMKLIKTIESTDDVAVQKRLTKTIKNGVYSNKQILQAIQSGHIVFHPYREEHIAGSSVDVTLGEWFYRTEKDGNSGLYNPFDPNDVKRYFEGPHKAVRHDKWAKDNNKPLLKGIPKKHPIIVLGPGERILAHTHEFIGIKPPGTSTMQSRSTWGRNGVAVCLDAGWGDPGYINRWTMEIYNMNQHEYIVLPVGERIAQLVFYSTGEVEDDYTKSSGKYQTFKGYDLKGLIADWNPQQMLPRAYKDKRELPVDVSDGLDALTLDKSQTVEFGHNTELAQPAKLIKKLSNDTYKITDDGYRFLDQSVTDTTGDVYAFKDNIPTATVAAAMARLSRRGDDMRITLLDEFAGQSGNDQNLLRRVITAYGDDSVQQLTGIHLVIENASNLLTKKLEWGRLASYLEQSTRYIYFDKKDKKGNYKYLTPANLDAKTAQVFEETMNQIFDLYSQMVHKLTDYIRSNSDVPKKQQDVAWKGATRAQACDAIRAVLPVATKSTVGIFASAQAAESLYMHLMSDRLLEAQSTGSKLLDQIRLVNPVFFERADKPSRGGAAIVYKASTADDMKKLAEHELPQNLSPETSDVQLIDYWPRNELNLLPHMLFEYSSLPLVEIEEQISKWSYDQKVKAFQTYMGERLNRRHRPGRALENAHYSWELVCDYGIFRDLQRHRIVDDLNWQELSPRYGYEVPDLVEEAGISNQFESCFDLSYQLYSKMQAAGYELEAQYATLLGHKMRWKVTYNAREAFHLHELRTSPQGHPGYRKLVKKMHDSLANVHPLIAESMIFVNKDEDPKLTRLAAERYTHFKLNQLEKNSKG